MMTYRRKLLILSAATLSLLALLLSLHTAIEDRALYRRLSGEARLHNEVQMRCLHRQPGTTTHTPPCKLGSVFQNRGCVSCTEGTFSMPHWSVCRRLLDCDEINHDIIITYTTPLVTAAGHWKFNIAEWRNHEVLLGTAEQAIEKESAEVHLDQLEGVLPHPNIVYPIGYCEESSSIALARNGTYRYLGSGTSVDSILAEVACDHWTVRLRLVLDYITILSHLHFNPSGPLVLCNSNSLNSLLSQFVITDKLSLVLVTLDNLPRVASGGVKCNRLELQGDFVAPEQKWPFGQLKVFNPDEQPGYDERSDVWKVPDVSARLLGNSEGSERVIDLLRALHHQCKSSDPALRPSSRQVLEEYLQVWEILVGE